MFLQCLIKLPTATSPARQKNDPFNNGSNFFPRNKGS